MGPLSEGEVSGAGEEKAHSSGSDDGLATPVSQTHVELSLEAGPVGVGGKEGGDSY